MPAAPERRIPGGRAAGVVVVSLVLAGLVPTAGRAHPSPEMTVRALSYAVVDGPRDDQRVTIDATLYVPATATPARPAPVVVLAHGFGGSKDDLAALARQTAHAGYVALAYSARGFAGSIGAIGLDSVDYDVKDVSQILDALARMPEVLLDRPGDPRVGITGRSYGGGIALMAAASDPRVDAIAPRITWSSLVYALAPNNLLPFGDAPPGPLKLGWTTILFGRGVLERALGPPSPDGLLRLLPGAEGCAGFVPGVCQAYLGSVAAGLPTAGTVAILQRSSPDRLADRLDVPTFLVQGEADTLFNLIDSVRNLEALRSNGAPVKLLWHSGGHSGSLAPGEEDQGLDPDGVIDSRVLRWWDRWLRRDPEVETGPGFELALGEEDGRPRYVSAPRYPAFPDTTLYLSGDGVLVGDASRARAGSPTFANPPLGLPAALSEMPGVQRFVGLPALELPGQHVGWETEPFPRGVTVVGVPRLRLPLSSDTGEAWFFAKLYDVAPDGGAELIGRQVSPVRATDLSAPLDIALPGTAHRLEPGHRLGVVLASTDLAYANRRVPDRYTVTVDPTDPPRLEVPLRADPPAG
ncbi:MAG: alpha/beta fold hydrolase [Acidimicrobiales bacterium]